MNYLNMAGFSIKAGYIHNAHAIQAYNKLKKWADTWGNNITDDGIRKMCSRYQNELLQCLPNNKAADTLRNKLFNV